MDVWPRQQHDETVDADADSGRRRHAVFQRAHEIPIRLGRLVVAAGAVEHLRFEAAALIVGIVQLGKRVRHFHLRAEQFVAFGQLRIVGRRFASGEIITG